MTLSPNLGRLDTGSSKDVSSVDERSEGVNAVISGGHFFSDAVRRQQGVCLRQVERHASVSGDNFVELG